MVAHNNTYGVTKRDIESFAHKISFLCELKITKNNSKLLTEYFFQEFSTSPGLFGDFIVYIKHILISGEDSKIQEKLARRYLSIISFLCERFGLYEDKLELDDLCFKITEPQQYLEISTQLEKYKKKSEKIIKQVFSIFNKKLNEQEINAKVIGRYKNILSIYKKCKKKNNMNALTLKDIFAFRIITQSNNSKVCFRILNMLHDSFIPLPERFKDYITIPKINGYQSIHTGLLEVIPDLDLTIEVQIRTHNMHNISEHGVAAHYLYAKNKKASINNRKEKKLFDHIMSDTNKNNESNIIYCLTSKGDIIKIEKNAPITKFAQKIHSELAKKAKYALVNNEKKDLSYGIQPWDKIEIITQ